MEPISKDKSYSVYSLKYSAFGRYKTDIYVKGQNPGFKVGDVIKWSSFDNAKSFSAKVTYKSGYRTDLQYPNGYYILTVNNSTYNLDKKYGFGSSIKLVSSSNNAVEDTEQPKSMMGINKKTALLGLLALVVGVYVFRKKIFKGK